ncbi:hypothetical protein NDU88_005226 [Pleurodeles waltl]|uniref:Reverse transcriptase domain-containing protein n=1 Tax=Pleurodeles waltl TaxID=8319 RepID=A0AAV7NPY8_PLEWA|nr:hypothetical protein NDU88_005226 [Pleurodeles waltl]
MEGYASTVSVDTVVEFLDGLRIPKLTEAQAECLEEGLQLEELQEALRAMPCGKSLGPYCLPAKFYQVYLASLLPGLLEMLCKARKEATIVMIPKPDDALVFASDPEHSVSLLCSTPWHH